MSSREHAGEILALIPYCFYMADRFYKFMTIVLFFSRRRDLTLEASPAVSLIQPITAGASGLCDNLRARLLLDYPGTVQHLFVCDQKDAASQKACREALAVFPNASGQIVCIASAGGIAAKVAKMQAGAREAAGEILCFIDDDVAPRPDNLSRFVRALLLPDTGAVFGLACYTNWTRPGSALMSAFVNSNVLTTYIPIAALIPPFTITGHFFALQRSDWQEIGGLDGLPAERGDDDHEIARRVRKAGKRIVQTEVIYDVNNALPTLRDYNRQMQRWSTFMRVWCWPGMTARERAASLFNMIGNLIPTLLLAVALVLPGRSATVSILGVLLVNIRMFAAFQGNFLGQSARWSQMPYVVTALLFAPYQMLLSPLWGNAIYWRAQRYRVRAGGLLERIE